MHQDEDNQSTQPVPVAVPISGESPEMAAAPEAPATAFAPAEAGASYDASAVPEPAFAEIPVETETAHTDTAPMPPPFSPEPSPYASSSWASTDESSALFPAVPTEVAGEPSSQPLGFQPSWQGPGVAADNENSAPAYATDEVPTPPPGWVTPPLSDSPVAEGARETHSYERPAEPHIEMPQGGPNWMLAFVCAWAAFTSFMEAPVAYAAKETMVNGSTVTLTAGDRLYGGLGFGLLGLGLLLFGIEALLWGRRRRGVSALLSIGLPVLVSLAGVVCLILSHYPGSRI